MSNNDFMQALINSGWILEKSNENNNESKNALLDKAKSISESYYNWCSTFSALYSEDEKTWFVSVGDFNGDTDLAFSWNEFEKISLDSCSNKEEENSVIGFWRSHLPVLMSTKGGYRYIALKLSGQDSGAFYYGSEPEFEFPIKVFDDFEQLKLRISSIVEQGDDLFFGLS